MKTLDMNQKSAPNYLLLGTVVVALVLAWSGIAPYDRTTWWMEVAPVFVVYPLLWLTRRRFEWSDLLYALIAAHAIVLIVGGAYSYARVPFGFWLQELLGDSRNPYDKIGHFMQGFVPAMAAREWLWRRKLVASVRVASWLGVCVAMTVSAVYELVEWLAAVLLGQGADEFLGTQGYVWDTQSDMGFALLGAVFGMLILSGLHQRQMRARR
jgi:putative membrane protein